MNADVLKGKWRQLKGSAKEQWGRLTDDDLRIIDGREDRLVGKLQEKYGYSKEKALEEYNRFMEAQEERRKEEA